MDRRLLAVVVMLLLLGVPLLTTDLMEERSSPPEEPDRTLESLDPYDGRTQPPAGDNSTSSDGTEDP